MLKFCPAAGAYSCQRRGTPGVKPQRAGQSRGIVIGACPTAALRRALHAHSPTSGSSASGAGSRPAGGGLRSELKAGARDRPELPVALGEQLAEGRGITPVVRVVLEGEAPELALQLGAGGAAREHAGCSGSARWWESGPAKPHHASPAGRSTTERRLYQASEAPSPPGEPEAGAAGVVRLSADWPAGPLAGAFPCRRESRAAHPIWRRPCELITSAVRQPTRETVSENSDSLNC